MQIFELHFNPRAKNEITDQIFDSFCYEPKNIYEKRLGSLYMVGELRNLLPQNRQLLNNLSQVIKGKFYATPLQTPEKAFEEGVKKANEFLAEEVSKENVNWLGNLSFAVLSLKALSQRKPVFGDSFILSLSKVGNSKILLLRGGKIIDIGKNLELEEIEPYPLKIFINAVSGKLSFGDKIMILTQEVFDFFSKENLLNEFIKFESFDERKIREILKPKEKELSEISGVFLFIDTEKEPLEKPRIVTFQKELEKFSLKEVFTPLIKILIRLGFLLKKFLNKILSRLRRGCSMKSASNLEKIFRFPKLKTRERLSFNLMAFRPKIRFTENLKRNLVLVLVFFFLLIAGFFIFQGEEKKQLKEKEKILSEIQEKIFKAGNFLIFKNEEKANILFKEAWEEILPLTKEEDSLKNKAISLKDSIEINLKNLSKLEVISEPELIFEFDPKEFIPQKMVYFNGNLYFFSPLSEKLYKVNPQTIKNNNFYSFGKTNEVSLATISDNSILFFSKPDKIIFFKEDKFGEYFSLKPPYPDFNFVGFSSYQRNIYFLDNQKGEIIKYLSPLEKGKESPQFGLLPQTKKATDSKSMAIDGSIWILSEINTISRYHNGQYQTDLIFDFFPAPKKLYKIFTLPHLPYLYLLEPVQNRIIILKKTGEIFKQFQSEKFENLKDFAVSENGKIIYLLNNQAVYQLTL